MIHARLTHEELRLLRRNVTRTIRVAKQPGKRTPQLGAQVQAYARAVVEDGEVVRKRETLRCVILEVKNQPGAWIVTYRAGTVEPARFLRARPGMVKLTPNPEGGDPIPDGDADYTTSTASAARGEPECVPESWERQVARTRDAGIPERVQHRRRGA